MAPADIRCKCGFARRAWIAAEAADDGQQFSDRAGDE